MKRIAVLLFPNDHAPNGTTGNRRPGAGDGRAGGGEHHYGLRHRDGRDARRAHRRGRFTKRPTGRRTASTLFLNSEGHLYRVPVEGGQPERIPVEGLDELNNDHGISPDGTRLVVSNGDGHIYTLPLEGRHARARDRAHAKLLARLVAGRRHPRLHRPARRRAVRHLPHPRRRGARSGRWPPTPPTKTALTSRRTGSGSTSTRTAPAPLTSGAVRPDGSDLEQITSDAYEDWFPHPSPDGAHVVFLSYAPGTPRAPALPGRPPPPDGARRHRRPRDRGAFRRAGDDQRALVVAPAGGGSPLSATGFWDE